MCIIDIRSSKQSVTDLPGIRTIRDTDVDDSVIQELLLLPKGKHITVQTCERLSDRTLKKLNSLFKKRPDIRFRFSGGTLNKCDLGFLSLVPAVSKLILNGMRSYDTDFSVLGEFRNLRQLVFDVMDVKDYSFLDTLTDKIEDLYINADMVSGKSKFDCRSLLRFHSLRSLYLGYVDKNLDSIPELPQLEKLRLRGVGAKDLSFLKRIPLKELEISWCSASKVDWDSLRDFESLRSLTLFSIKKLEDVSFISTLTNLEVLRFIWMGAVTKLPDLSKLRKLRIIDFDTCNKLTDVSSLITVTTLEDVHILSRSLPKREAEALLNNHHIRHLDCGGDKYHLTKD